MTKKNGFELHDIDHVSYSAMKLIDLTRQSIF